MGESLGAAFYGVWIWAEVHYQDIQKAREAFAEPEKDAALIAAAQAYGLILRPIVKQEKKRIFSPETSFETSKAE